MKENSNCGYLTLLFTTTKVSSLFGCTLDRMELSERLRILVIRISSQRWEIKWETSCLSWLQLLSMVKDKTWQVYSQQPLNSWTVWIWLRNHLHSKVMVPQLWFRGLCRCRDHKLHSLQELVGDWINHHTHGRSPQTHIVRIRMLKMKTRNTWRLPKIEHLPQVLSK